MQFNGKKCCLELLIFLLISFELAADLVAANLDDDPIAKRSGDAQVVKLTMDYLAASYAGCRSGWSRVVGDLRWLWHLASRQRHDCRCH